MLDAKAGESLANLWDAGKAAGMSEPDLLLYRSNLLGADKRITNYGGGNTSAKVMERDPLTGAAVEVLWVKGSGGDIGSIRMDGFATLYMAKLDALKGLYRGLDHEDEMVGYLPHCTFRLNPRAASIDTPLHAYVPRRHVDHVHADAIIAIAASANSKELTERIFVIGLCQISWSPLPCFSKRQPCSMRCCFSSRRNPAMRSIAGVRNLGVLLGPDLDGNLPEVGVQSVQFDQVLDRRHDLALQQLDRRRLDRKALYVIAGGNPYLGLSVPNGVDNDPVLHDPLLGPPLGLALCI